MTQFTFGFVGVVLGLLYSIALRRRRLGPLAAIVVGAGAAWSCALLAATFSSGGWRSWGWLSLGASVVGGAGALVLLDLYVGSVQRGERPAPIDGSPPARRHA